MGISSILNEKHRDMKNFLRSKQASLKNPQSFYLKKNIVYMRHLKSTLSIFYFKKVLKFNILCMKEKLMYKTIK